MANENSQTFTHFAAPCIRPEDRVPQDIRDAAAKAGYGVPFISPDAEYAARAAQAAPKPANE